MQLVLLDGEFVEDGLGGGQQMQPPDAAVGWVGAALEQVAGLEPVGEAGDGDGLDLEQFGQLLLRQAGLAIEPDRA